MIYVCYGAKKSGSTLTCKLTLALLKEAGHPHIGLSAAERQDVSGDGVATNTVRKWSDEVIEAALSKIPAPHIVAFRTHHAPSEAIAAAVEAGLAKVQICIRDPRDLALSMWDVLKRHRASGRERPGSALDALPDMMRHVERNLRFTSAWSDLGTPLLLKYEQTAFDPDASIQAICDDVGLRIPRERFSAIFEEVTNTKNAQQNKNVARPRRHETEMELADQQEFLTKFKDFYDRFLPESATPSVKPRDTTAPAPVRAPAPAPAKVRPSARDRRARRLAVSSTASVTVDQSKHVNGSASIPPAASTGGLTQSRPLKKKILVMGLPGAGKTTLARVLALRLNAVHYNADEVRANINKDLGFSEDDRIEQARRMGWLCDIVADRGNYVIADFVCPTAATREAFGADKAFLIWVDRIKEGRFVDTNKMFGAPSRFDLRVNADGSPEYWAEKAAALLRPVFDFKKQTALMLGRYQPFHDAHKALIVEAIHRVGQVCIAVRDTQGTDEKNPHSFEDVRSRIEDGLRAYEGCFAIMPMPNITNMFHGHDVGCEIERIDLDQALPDVSRIAARPVKEETASWVSTLVGGAKKLLTGAPGQRRP